MALSEEQRRETELLAELACRRMVSEIVDGALPRIIEAAFNAHNADQVAHVGLVHAHEVSCPMNRWKWVAIGAAGGAGLIGGGEGLAFALVKLFAP